ncbi:MAG TPA: heat-inducible transcriptional repressor HrcA [Verrucomicrobiae bacterium]|nr:heat-inducible transcriptional repressor HrcA [Verrucomicrobiae bacterium]HXU47867.1 heat-inducible transcriptional repressor HrcA [Candidatus Binatia bacterium]
MSISEFRQSSPSRHDEILHLIVQSYIESGEPVSSRIISRRLRRSLSAASVRNVMADLYEQGFLSQPHTSAGRVPTAKAYRTYVQSLARAKILNSEFERLREELRRLGSLEARVERSSHLLTEITSGIGIAVAIPALAQSLDRIELVELADRRVLVVLITRDGMVRNRVVVLEDGFAQDDLISIRNYLNRNFAGWPLPSIHTELKRRLEQESAAYDAILRRLTVLYAKGLLDVGFSPEIHLEGASNLVGLDLHLTRERMRELFRALEEKKKILHLLDRFLVEVDGEVAVQVGLGDAHPSMGELSLIGLAIPLAGGLSAKIAVLGPMRMNYQRAMTAVRHLGDAIQSIPS